jgi:hypothetical protein
MPAFYIVLERELAGVDAVGIEGRALSNSSKQLDALATQAGVKSLSSFFSVKKSEVVELLEGNDLGFEIPDEQWFPANEGLRTIAVLLKELRAELSIRNKALVEELGEFERVREAAKSSNVRWHLAIDY